MARFIQIKDEVINLDLVFKLTELIASDTSFYIRFYNVENKCIYSITFSYVTLGLKKLHYYVDKKAPRFIEIQNKLQLELDRLKTFMCDKESKENTIFFKSINLKK